MNDIQFGKVVTETPNSDGSTTIREEGRYKGVTATTKISIRVDIDTDGKNVAKDLISCLDVLNKSQKILDIRILKDKFGNPFLIQKTWTETTEGKPLPK